MDAVFKGSTTRAESKRLKRKEKQDELGVCRIRRTTGDQRSQTLGSGFVVKDLQIFPDLDFFCCLISSDKVFPKDDCNIESYYLDFKKLDSSNLKTIKLKDVAGNPANFVRTSGLVVIPINPSKKCHKGESIFDYRPFKVANAEIAPGEDLKCYFVDDGPGRTKFSVIALKLNQSETVSTQYQIHEALERPYTTYDELTRQGNRKPYGAVILKKRRNDEFLAVGALTFTDNECRNITSAFFPLHLVKQTSESFSDRNESPVLVSEQQASVDDAPSIDVESPGVASRETSGPFSDCNESPVPISEQQASVDNAPSTEAASPGVASRETSESVPDGNEYHVSEQQPPANNATSTDGSQVTSTAVPINIRVDVDTTKPAEHNTQERTVSAIESEGSQDGEHQGASAVPVSSGHPQPSCAGAEALQAPNRIHTTEEILGLIAFSYLQTIPPRCKADYDDFAAYLEKMRLHITGVRTGSLLITVKCNSLQILERLWEDYSSGHLGEVVQRCFVTEEILTELSLAELKLKTTISEEEYKACKKYLGKDPAGEADDTYDSDDSASDDEDQCGSVAVPVQQPIHEHFPDEENLTQRDEEDDLQTETAEEKLKTGTDEGSSVSDDEDQLGFEAPLVPSFHYNLIRSRYERLFWKGRDDISPDSGISSSRSSSSSAASSLSASAKSSFGSLSSGKGSSRSPSRVSSFGSLSSGKGSSRSPSRVSSFGSSSSGMGSSRSSSRVSSFGSSPYSRRLARLRIMKDKRQIVKTELKKFDMSSPKELQDYLTYLTHEMDSAGLLRTSGSVSDKPFFTWEHISTKRRLKSTTPEEQPDTEEEKNSQEGGTNGDQHTVSSSGSELQGDAKWARSIALQKTSEQVQESPSVKHLTEAMDDKLLRVFVTIHVKERAWQVVKLFLDELIRRDRGNNDGDAVSGDLKSRTLSWWPTNEDQDLEVLCKALTESDCKLDGLDFRGDDVTDDGVKHIAEALSNSTCALNSLNLSCCKVTDEGVKHIAKALSNSNCALNSLHLDGNNKITDEGVKHIAEALSISTCALNSLNLSFCKVTNEGVKHIAEALSNSNCALNSLNLSCCKVTDEGVKHIAEALSNSNCALSSLHLSWCKVTDEGVKHIAEALSNSHCHLNSLYLSCNYRIADEGVKHIAEALSNSNCALNSLNISCCKVTNEGVKYIAEAVSNSNCHLNSLDLSGNDVTDEGMKHIAEALSNSHCHLNSLYLIYNVEITDKGVRHLAEALEHSKYKLESFDRLQIEVTGEVQGQVSEEGLS